jgi:phycobilisome core component
VPTGPTVRSIALMADVVCEQLSDAGVASPDAINAVVRAPFDHLCRGLADTNVRAR